MSDIVDSIVRELKSRLLIEVEASGRHVHLSRRDVVQLFGENYQLTPVKDLSQPGQFVCKERVTICGPKGRIENVVVLGPERAETQVEVSLTDSNILGSNPPIRISGDTDFSPGVTIINPKNGRQIEIQEGLIVAKRHIHMTPEAGEQFHVKDGETVKVKIFSDRSLIFDDMEVRVSPKFRTYIHIDYDEANACGYHRGTYGMILK